MIVNTVTSQRIAVCIGCRATGFRRTGRCQRQFTEAQINVFNTGAWTRDIPVVEVDHVDVMTLIEALTCPQRGARQPVNQVFTLYVHLTESGVSGFPVVLLRYRVSDVGVKVEALIAFFPDFWPSFNSA